MKIQKLKTSRFGRIKILIAILLIAGVGSYLVVASRADYDCAGLVSELVSEQECAEMHGYADLYIHNKNNNPALGNSCTTGNGLDIALLVDVSGSMSGGPLIKAREAMRTFIRELSGTKTYFAIGRIDKTEFITSFTNNQAEALAKVDAPAIYNGNGNSNLGNLRDVIAHDPRPGSPNLIIILTDGQINYDLDGARAVQQAGTRILAIGFGDIDIEVLKLIAGPNVNTGSIWTSDVITTGLYRDMDGLTYGGSSNAASQESLESALKTVATQCKGPGPGLGDGDGGTGTGTNGQGEGQGPGVGTGGAGGGGGSSAKKIAEQPNPIPTSSSQGTAKSADQDPSPFFDGREFKRGSDTDNLVFGNSTIGGKKVPKILLYILSALLLGGAGGALYWRWKRQKA